MSCFSSKCTATVAEPDPAKHVNYNVGMVLGVDDFTQEFAYLSGRDQWLARDLIGYGTVRGLNVEVEVDAGKGPRVVVEPGVAVSPRGQLICVPAAQCAYLNDWLTEHTKDMDELLGSPAASSLPLYVVLCYRDCPTDNVPIAGEPCRSEDQLMAPSRLIDSFSLELRTRKPSQREESAVRDFVGWLRQVEVSDLVVSSTPLDQFLQAIRDAAKSWFTDPLSSPPASPPGDFMVGSPPAFLQIRASEACRYWRAAFRLWVTELRPKWIERWHGCAATHFTNDDVSEEDCVLLAELSVPIAGSPGNWIVANSPDVALNQEQRPYVIHLRMLQEWLLCGGEPKSFVWGSPLEGGLPGPPGPQGPVGDKGPAGDKGPVGDKGPSGDKGPAGDGAPGDKGPVGDKGAPGDKGPAGDKGAAGNKGPAGDKGAAGDKGTAGDKGPTGDKGAAGDKGPVGDKGATGNKGPVGDQGPPGDPGTGGDFVEHPPGLPHYAIVAAGIVRDGGGRVPIYNALNLAIFGPGQVLLTFNGYTQPDGKFQYIVKALVCSPGEQTFTSATVTFREFRKEGILLNLSDQGRVPTGDQLKGLELMIEISRFEGSTTTGLKN